MSLIFTPKIAASYDSIKPLKVKVPTVAVSTAIKTAFSFGSGRLAPVVKRVDREAMLWNDADLQKLIKLRAIGITFTVCAKHFNRSAAACGSVINTRNLYKDISKRREILMNEALA